MVCIYSWGTIHGRVSSMGKVLVVWSIYLHQTDVIIITEMPSKLVDLTQ